MLPPNPVYFEFGAGWDLYANLVQWCYGLDRQFVYDLRRWARAAHVNAALRHLHDEPPPNAVRVPTQSVDDARLDDDLRRLYGIDYRAPADAGATGLPGGSSTASRRRVCSSTSPNTNCAGSSSSAND